MPEKISTGELLARVLEARLRDLHNCIPGKVTKFDATAKTVDVELQFLHQLPDGEGGFTTEAYPKLRDVPCAYPRGKGMFFYWPYDAGDFVEVRFTDRALGAWRQLGSPCDPGDLTMHGLAGAVAHPGAWPVGKEITNSDASNVVIGSDSNPNSRIVIKPGGEIDLGAGATKGVAREGDTTVADTTLAQWIADVTAKFNAPAAPMASAPGTLTPPTDFGKISGCSAHIKAND